MTQKGQDSESENDSRYTWPQVPLRALFEERVEKNFEGHRSDYLSLVANVGVMPYAEKGDIGNKKPEDLGKCKFVSVGDFVINSMNFGIGAFGLSAYEGICSPVYIVLTPKLGRIEPRFALRLFEDRWLQTYTQSLGNGILAHRAAVNWNNLKGIKIPLPSSSEQLRILSFLDRETAKIDALVGEQRRLIELLKEKRQAVISHAVTKGLDPDARMKDSGIGWPGSVPSHWKLRPLKHLANFKSGGTPDKSRLDFWDGNIPWASAKDLKVAILNDTEDHITQAALDCKAAALVASGSLLVVVRGMILARIFPVVRANVAMAINQDLKAITPNEGICSDYLEFLMRGAESAILSNLDEAGHGTKALRMDKWGSMMFPVPPMDEQLRIAARAKSDCISIDNLRASAERAIELLQERRAALISAAVTGKIDVRGIVEQERTA